MLPVERAKGGTWILLEALHKTVRRSGQGIRSNLKAIGQEVLYPAETGPGQLLIVIRAPVRHKEHRGCVETFDQQPGFLVDREGEGSGHMVHAFGLQPRACRNEQRICRFLNIQTFV